MNEIFQYTTKYNKSIKPHRMDPITNRYNTTTTRKTTIIKILIKENKTKYRRGSETKQTKGVKTFLHV